MAGEPLRLSDGRVMPDWALIETFIQSSGPGGQNVNKVATAVELRFDADRSPALSEPVRQRLKRLAGSRLTKDGVIVIFADRYRTQERNRADALRRLIDLIRRAAVEPKRRRATRPPAAAKERRLKDKSEHSIKKKLRRSPLSPEE